MVNVPSHKQVKRNHSGQLTVTPGNLETDRRAYAAVDCWEGEGKPSHPDAPSLDDLDDSILKMNPDRES
jgi:hypothetical protein